MNPLTDDLMGATFIVEEFETLQGDPHVRLASWSRDHAFLTMRRLRMENFRHLLRLTAWWEDQPLIRWVLEPGEPPDGRLIVHLPNRVGYNWTWRPVDRIQMPVLEIRKRSRCEELIELAESIMASVQEHQRRDDMRLRPFRLF